MLLSQEELAKTAQIDPDVAKYLAAMPPRAAPTDANTPWHLPLRRQIGLMSKATLDKLGPPPAGTKEFYHEISMRDGFKSSIKIFKPDNGGGPLFVFAFGGGFLGGDNDQLSREARAAVKLFGATVVNINYRLGPENKFPTAQQDTEDSLRWVASNARGELLSADPSKGFILGGVSAGGCLTASIARKVQEEPLEHPLTGLWLCIPAIMSPDVTPEKYKAYHVSRVQNAENPVMPTVMVEKMLALSEVDESSPLAWAVLSKSPLAEQPKAYFQVAGMDPIRDDALIYEEMLKEAGVPTKLDLYPGCPHGHQMMPGLALADKANIDAAMGFGWLLSKEVSREDAARAMGL